jgi:aspartate kinase
MLSAMREQADIVVMKFGGTSVAGAEQIKRAAGADGRRARERQAGGRGALGAWQDDRRARRQAMEISERPVAREMDMLLSTGERISCALCAMAIHDMGHKAISLTGSQAGIVTDSSHTKARIIDVRADRIRDALTRTGSCSSPASRASRRRPRTSPRSAAAAPDTTAVALRRRLEAEVCEIYTDVAGVFSADPRIVAGRAQAGDRLARGDARDVGLGAKVLQLRSVEYARNHGVRIHCRSSFEEAPVPSCSEDETMEAPLVTAVTHSDDEARVTLTGVRDEPGVAGRIFTALAGANVNVDMIIQNEPVSDDRARRPLLHGRALGPYDAATSDRRARRAQPGVQTDERDRQGLDRRRRHAQPPRRRRPRLRDAGRVGINIEMISTSPIKISCVIDSAQVPAAVKALHQAFELGEDAVRREDPTGPTTGPPSRHEQLPGRCARRHRRSRLDDPRGARRAGLSRRRGGALCFGALRGKKVSFNGSKLKVRELREDAIEGPRRAALLGRRQGERRMGADLRRRGRGGRRQHQLLAHARGRALVVSEVNPEALDGHKGIVANPNCTTMEMVVALARSTARRGSSG